MINTNVIDGSALGAMLVVKGGQCWTTDGALRGKRIPITGFIRYGARKVHRCDGTNK